MTGKTHQTIGLTAGLVSFLVLAPAAYGPATLAFVLVGSSLASLLPDIDSPASRFWSYIPLGRIAGEVMDTVLEHRNLSHSLLGGILAGWGLRWALGFVPPYWGVDTGIVLTACLAAFASHLLADMVTVGGIPLFYPYQRTLGLPPRPFEGMRIVTGKWFENLVLYPVANLVLFSVVVSNWNSIRIVLLK